MTRVLPAIAFFAIAGLTISTVTLALADDPPPPVRPGQPKAVQVRPARPVQVQPAQPGFARAAARMAQLEEEFETLEAHRDVKKAIVRAAEVAVRAAKASYELIAKGPTAYPQQEVDKAKFALEAVEAQLEIRVAEMKEVEVKIKHARKRLEDAKAAGARPAPGIIRPEETLPIGPPPVAKEQQAKIELLTQVVAERRADLQKCEADLKLAEAELTRILEIARIGRVRAGTIEAAEATVMAARATLAKAAAELKECEDALAKAKGNRR